LARDGNNRPRVKQLAAKLADEALDYCIPRSRIAEAFLDFERTGSAAKVMQLGREAKTLFTTLEKSGEGGELLLYLLMEVGLGIPQILCKMSLKTDPMMHLHGTDGVHAQVLPNGHLALYWCESKLYATPGRAINACIAGIAPYLLDVGDGSSAQDLLLVRDNLDTGDEEVTAALRHYLQLDTEEALALEIRGACLVGFNVSTYPNPFHEDGQTVIEEVANAVSSWYSKVLTRIKHHKLHSFEIEVFFVPMPSVAAFRAALRNSLTLA